MQPYEAVKAYRCPGCDHEIRPGEGHEVVVPLDAPEDRRHWHTGCWHREAAPPQPRRAAVDVVEQARARGADQRQNAASSTSTIHAPRPSGGTDATSKRSSRARRSCAPSHSCGQAPDPQLLPRVTASAPMPNASACGSSPRRTRRRRRARARDRSRPPGSASCGRAPRSRARRTSAPASPRRGRRAPGGSEVLAGELLDVHVLERHDVHVGDERAAGTCPTPTRRAARARSTCAPFSYLTSIFTSFAR